MESPASLYGRPVSPSKGAVPELIASGKIQNYQIYRYKLSLVDYKVQGLDEDGWFSGYEVKLGDKIWYLYQQAGIVYQENSKGAKPIKAIDRDIQKAKGMPVWNTAEIPWPANEHGPMEFVGQISISDREAFLFRGIDGTPCLITMDPEEQNMEDHYASE